jgi:hypothetical protein
LAISIPTGPQSFGGATWVRNYNNVELQPYLGYQWVKDRFYILGFEAINVPLNTHDVTFIYNDIGVGYFVYQNKDPRAFLKAFAPTFETHVNVPLNHRDIFNFNDKAGSADIVDLTYGANFWFLKRAQLSLGAVTPVTGPRPFSIEALVLLNVYF